MATARKVLVDTTVTPFYHCISRCVRRAFLCGNENGHRKQWIEDRLQELGRIFAINICGFAILDNHLHVLLRLDLAESKSWSAEEVVRRWIELCPPKDHYRKPVVVTKAWITDLAADIEWVEERRQRLTDLVLQRLFVLVTLQTLSLPFSSCRVAEFGYCVAMLASV
jgi:hypothetical protein